MLEFENLPPVLSPYMMARTEVLNEMLCRYPVDPDLRWRATYLRTMNRLLSPFRWLEDRLYNPKVRRTELAGPPVMILGHWRSGTTHLHYTLREDPQFGVVSNGQMATPTCYFTLGRWLTRLAPLLPHIRRPMDNLPVGVDMPQEEELAMPGVTTATVYYYWMLPRELPGLFDRYCLFEGVGDSTRNAFLSAYHFILQQATLDNPGKRLLLKNPPNTARIALLAQRYPQAKFIHIHRNPYDVYRSTRHLYDKMSAGFGLQTVTPAQRDEIILYVYERMMRAYLEQRRAIPRERLVEVRFEDLERKPMDEIERIYQALELPGWRRAAGSIEAYLSAQRSYQKNRYQDDPEAVRQVNRRWQFAFEAFGYRMAQDEAA